MILYGLLSEKPAGNINPLLFLFKKCTLESFYLPYYMAGLEKEKVIDFSKTSEQLC